MPLGVKPECSRCEVKESPLWHATDAGNLCNDCLESERNADGDGNFHGNGNSEAGQDDDDKNSNNEASGGNATRPARKSTRVTRYCKGRPPATVRVPPKGKGRRHIFKKTQPTKAPAAVATPVTSDFVFYKGSYFQVGDIVSMRDIDGGLYYAQIRGLLTDQYCEKSAAVTWLVPTTASPPPEEGFRPETYIIGPEEDLLRKLECMEFVMHAPSDYYKLKNTPYPPRNPLADAGVGAFVWTSLKNEIHPIKK